MILQKTNRQRMKMNDKTTERFQCKREFTVDFRAKLSAPEWQPTGIIRCHLHWFEFVSREVGIQWAHTRATQWANGKLPNLNRDSRSSEANSFYARRSRPSLLATFRFYYASLEWMDEISVPFVCRQSLSRTMKTAAAIGSLIKISFINLNYL